MVTCARIRFFKLCCYNCLVVIVNLLSQGPLEVDESSGFVEICAKADHAIQVSFNVTFTTLADTATGKSSYMYII